MSQTQYTCVQVFDVPNTRRGNTPIYSIDNI
nr:MAG TPA: hypothetical protein [Caudoviricetes sp.]